MTRFLSLYRDTRDPLSSDDCNSTLRLRGFKVGDRWINTSSGMMFTCLENTAGEAVWNCRCRPVFDTSPSDVPAKYGAISKDEVAKKIRFKFKLDDDSIEEVDIGEWT